MTCRVFLSLSEGVRIEEDGEGRLAFVSPPAAFRPRLSLRQLTPALEDALFLLAGSGATKETLTALVATSEGAPGLAKLFHYLSRLDQLAILSRRLESEEGPFASLHPISPYLDYQDSKASADLPYVLSQFAYFRNVNGTLTLETPRGHARVDLIADSAVAALHELTNPRTAQELPGRVPGLDLERAHWLMRFLVNANAVVPSPDRNPRPEDADPVIGQWAFHDMLFHTRSRMGRHADPYGGTYPFKDKFAPLTIVKPPMSGDAIPLFTPDLEAITRTDSPFTSVLERRASLRDHTGEPLTVEQMGEFLYRSARIKEHAKRVDVSFRPSPSAGALHPLEIYPVVDRCKGLESGLYHYDPSGHQLFRLSGLTPPVRTLLELGGITAMLQGPPQVLFIITARFQRVQNKYQSVAYSVILKDVGCLYQTMYLVATAMGLAPCALGGGHSDLFAQAAGLDYFAETSVGDFVLGTVGPGARDRARGEEWHAPRGREPVG